MRVEQFNDAVNQIYAAALDQYEMKNAALSIQSLIGGHTVSLVIEDIVNYKFRYVFTNGATEEQIQRYSEEVLGEDELTATFEHKGVGSSWLSQDLWSMNTLEHFSAYQKFYRNVGWTFFTAGLFYRSEVARGYISIARSEHDALFKVEHQKDLHLLLPHLHRSLLINLTLLEQETTIMAYQEGLDHLSAGIIMFSEQGRVQFVNKAATSYLTTSKLLNSSFPVKLPNTKDSKRLQAEVNRILNSSSYCRSGYIRFINNGITYTAVCVPWNREFSNHTWLGSDSRCMVFILTQDCTPFSERILNSIFNLSHAEVNLVNVLCKGISAKAASEQLFVSEATVRYHIRNILRKTECKSLNSALTKILQTLTIKLI